LATPTTPGRHTFSRRQRGRKEPVEGTGVPRGASKPPDEACLMVENALLHLSPRKSSPPAKRPPDTPKLLRQNSLDTQLPFSYIHLTPKRVLIKSISLVPSIPSAPDHGNRRYRPAGSLSSPSVALTLAAAGFRDYTPKLQKFNSLLQTGERSGPEGLLCGLPPLPAGLAQEPKIGKTIFRRFLIRTPGGDPTG
jgi:hypothetical protein